MSPLRLKAKKETNSGINSNEENDKVKVKFLISSPRQQRVYGERRRSSPSSNPTKNFGDRALKKLLPIEVGW